MHMSSSTEVTESAYVDLKFSTCISACMMKALHANIKHIFLMHRYNETCLRWDHMDWENVLA